MFWRTTRTPGANIGLIALGLRPILLILASMIVAPLLLQGQPPPTEVQNLARRAAESIKDTNAQRILVSTDASCILDRELCGATDSALRAALSASIPSAQLLGRGEVAPLLGRHGFVPIDAYDGPVLEYLANDLGAQLVVVESLAPEPDGYEIRISVWDVEKRRSRDIFKTKVRGGKQNSEEPVLFKDENSGVSLIIGYQPDRKRPVFKYPSCVHCPAPDYPEAMRVKRLEGIVVLRATITEQGEAQNIAVVRSPYDGFTSLAVDAVRSWRFRPAIGKDELPFASRVPIEVNFRLRP
jgi:TonB family protein